MGGLFTLEAQWAEPVSLTFHFALRKLYTGPSIGASFKFRFNWLLTIGFRAEDFLEIDQSEIRIVSCGHFVNGSGRNVQCL